MISPLYIAIGGLALTLLLGMGLYFFGRLYYPEGLVKCNPEYEGRRLPVRAVVAIYHMKTAEFADDIDGLTVDFETRTWTFKGKIFPIGQGMYFDLASDRVGIIVLDGQMPLVGYGADQEGDLFEAACELALQAALKACHTPIGRLSVYEPVTLYPSRNRT